MTTPEMLNYMENELKRGVTRHHLKEAMIAHGWKEADIDEGFNYVQVPKKGINTSVVAAIIIILVIISGGSVFVYNVVTNTPENMLDTMSKNLKKVSSYEYKGSIKATVSSNTDPISQSETSSPLSILRGIQPTFASNDEFNFQADFNGKSDIQNKEDPKSEASISFAFNYPGASELLGASSFAVSVDTKLLAKTFYARVTRIPESEYGAMFSNIKNQWIEFPKNQSTPYGAANLFATPNEISEDPAIKKIQQNEEKIKQMYLKHRFIEFNNNVPSEKINSVDTKHYTFAINKTELVNFIVDVVTFATDKAPTQPEIDRFNEELKIIKEVTGDLWVGKSDTLPYKFSVKSTLQGTNENKQSGTIEFAMEFSNFNAPITITPPENPKTMEQLSQELSQSYMDTTGPGSIAMAARDSMRMSDLSNIRKAIDASFATGDITSLPTCTRTTSPALCSSLNAEADPYKTQPTSKGWLRLSLSSFISKLPIDPYNGQSITTISGKTVKAYYFFRSNGSEYKLATYLESPDNASRAANDGGTDPDLFETGTNLKLPIKNRKNR